MKPLERSSVKRVARSLYAVTLLRSGGSFFSSVWKSSVSVSGRRSRCQRREAIWLKRDSWMGVAGLKVERSSAMQVSKARSSSLGRWERARGVAQERVSARGSLRAFWEERRLPCAVRGPVDFWALARLAARRLG